MSSVSHARLGSEFESFLYAPIGQDNNGMPLSVLSALARQDVDPWDEAARLAQLPEEKAVTQLVSLLGAFPHAPLACPDPASTATRLITLLPRPRDHVHPSRNLFVGADPAKHPAFVAILLSVLTYMVFMLFSTWLIGRLQAPGPLQGPSTSAPNAISQPPPSSE
jgi:hypothetical protein